MPAPGCASERRYDCRWIRPISITTHKEADGHCTAVAHTRISGVDNAELVSVYAKLAGAMSVEYIDVKGKDPQTGAEIVERIRK